MRVDFYILTASDTRSRDQFACRLTEKAYLRDHQVYIHVDNKQQAHLLDELLWTFRDNNFIPHSLIGEDCALSPAVRIGYQQAPDNMSDLMLNLTLSIPPFYQNFQRTIEIVPAIPMWKEASRDHYRYYREHGCELADHKITSMQ